MLCFLNFKKIVDDYIKKFTTACEAAKMAIFVEKCEINDKSEELHHLVSLESTFDDLSVTSIVSNKNIDFDERKKALYMLSMNPESDRKYKNIDLEKSNINLENSTNNVESQDLSHNTLCQALGNDVKSTVKKATSFQSKKKIFTKCIGIMLSFIVVVSAWGFLDVVIEIAAAGNLKNEALYYAATFGTSLMVLIIYMHTCNREYHIEDSIDLF